MQQVQLAGYQATHFRYAARGKVATITLNRPDKKNPLTFDSYAELGALFRRLAHASDVKAAVITGEGGNFCSGGDVHEIIGPLVNMDMPGLLRFTRMTGELVKAMRECPQPIVAAIDGVCTGAGAMIACASDLRFATARSKLAFLFVRVGLAGADMGACTLLPRLIGLSRAADLLYTGRVVGGEEAERFGFHNRLVAPEALLDEATAMAQSLADGPTFGHAMTKTMLWQEWSSGLGECIEAEAQAQAICMQTSDFERAYRAFVAKQKPVFEGCTSDTGRERNPRLDPLDMPDRTFLEWPFFDDGHRAFVAAVDAFANRDVPRHIEGAEPDSDAVYRCVRNLVRAQGDAGLLRACVPAAFGGTHERIDVRSLCLAREALAHANGLADFAFAMQGLGSVPISLYGSEAQKRAWLPGVAAGTRIAAFALSEPEAGSDVSAIATTGLKDGTGWRLDGVKTWISNGGLADFYVVFARTEANAAKPSRGLSAFIVDASSPGLDASERIDVSAPHPLGTLRLTNCRVDADRLLGAPGDGFRIAMGTLDLFRTTVGAAALGFARRAAAEAFARVRTRRMFGHVLADFQLTQARLGDMLVAIDASALMVYRAAWTRDTQARRVTREASMAKLFATESAQQVIDAAVQLFGGRGVVRGVTVERLYREIRALRIYEGASEVLKLIIGARAAQPQPA